MTEAEWLACDDPQALVEFARGKVSDRKLRLLACANCRLLWKWLADDRSQAAIVTAERLADGLALEEERTAAYIASEKAATLPEYNDPDDDTTYLQSIAAAYAHYTLWESAFVAAHTNAPGGLPNLTGIPATLPLLQLRDCFGNPFRPVAFDPAWRTSTAVGLAEDIYADRAFDRLPILADALQDAGCEDADILGHCRGDGPHVRGCWVVDLVLGKE